MYVAHSSCCTSICSAKSLAVSRVSGEDLCVIVVASGMVHHHLPNNVLSAMERVYQEMVADVEEISAVESLQTQYKARANDAITGRSPRKIHEGEAKKIIDAALCRECDNSPALRETTF